MNPQIGAHQHSLPQPLPSQSIQQQQSIAHSFTQPKLVAQQQLTANPNPPNINHNGQYGPYSNPYGALPPNPYGMANPAAAYGQGGYPGLNMAASNQYPMAGPMNDQMGSAGGGMNYDYLNEFLY